MRTGPIASILVCLLVAPALGGDFAPQFAKANLLDGESEIAPSSIAEPPPDGIRVGDLRLLVQENTLVARRAADDSPVWSWTAPDGLLPQPVTVGAKTLFVFLWKKSGGDDYERAEPSVVRRIALTDGEALPSLKVPEPAEGERIRDILVSDGATVLLSIREGNAPIHGESILSYGVTSFAAGKVRWAVHFDSAGWLGGASALLLGGGGPSYAGPGVRPLSIVRNDLIVCAGGGQDIIALDRESGVERWRLPAIWEFERGFVGPSVWSHFLSRVLIPHDGFGTEEWRAKPDEEKEAAKRAGSERLRKMRRIVAGPIAVPYDGGDGEWNTEPQEGYRLFVAVARDRSEYAGGYLSDAFVYEVNHKGSPIAVLPLPRMVRGGFARDREVIWLCEGGAIGATAPSFQQESSGMGGGGTDHVGRLSWWRQPAQFEVPKCWMKTGRTGSHRVMLEDTVYFVPAGGYVVSKEERVFRFPITVLDLNTGAQRELLLAVPFTGDVPPPSGNYSKHSTPDGWESYAVMGPHALAIVDLEAREGELIVTVGAAGGETAALTFDLE